MNIQNYTLDRLSIGSSAIVSKLELEGAQKFRMMDLGLSPGSVVKALHKSPGGDPTAYSIMGAVIALRSDDAAKIILERREHGEKQSDNHRPRGES